MFRVIAKPARVSVSGKLDMLMTAGMRHIISTTPYLTVCSHAMQVRAMSSSAVPTAKLFIDGKFIESKTSTWYDVHNPVSRMNHTMRC